MAFLLVFGSEIAYWGLQIMIATCILMLWMLLTYEQWRFKIITIQHIVNELVLYVLCWMLLMFQGAFPRMDNLTYQFLGYIMMAILYLFIVFNLIVIVYDGIILHCRRHCRRRDNIVEFRKNRHKLTDLNRRNRYAWNQLREFHKKRLLLIKKQKLGSQQGKDLNQDNMSAVDRINLLVEKNQIEIIDNEQPPIQTETQVNKVNQIIIEEPATKSGNLAPNTASRNKYVNITTSVRSSIVKNKAPSIMSAAETTPRGFNESGS